MSFLDVQGPPVHTGNTGVSRQNCRLSTLSPVCCGRHCRPKVEHVQVGPICRKWVIFVARMSNVSVVTSVAERLLDR